MLLNENIEKTINYLFGALTSRNYRFNNPNLNLLESYFTNTQNKEIDYVLKTNTKESVLKLSIVLTETLSKDEQDKLNLKNIGKSPISYSAIVENKVTKEKEIDFLQPSSTMFYSPFIKYNLAFDNDLFRFYADRVQTSKQAKQDLLKNMELLVPNIENIEVTAVPDSFTTFLISLKNTDRPKLVNEYGDGSIKFLRYLLEILECKNDRLMIDEIDTGIHYSRMKDFWRILLKSAKENNVQIFATTHSNECMFYYKEALKETGLINDSRLISLEELPNKSVKAYTYEFESFANAIENNLELRGNN